MEISEHLAALRTEGQLLGTAAARTDLDTPIPTCPEWRMRDLLRHTGDVHRWAAAHVRQRRMEPIGRAELPEVAGPLPGDDDLLAWFGEGHAALLGTLESADPDTPCWTFLPAPSPIAFWARRQAHETAIHRADAESPGDAITPLPPAFAADGIDELLFGFLGGEGDPGPDPPRLLHLSALDTGGQWLVGLWEERLTVTEGPAPPHADCTVRAPASDLDLLLWNRRAPEGLDVRGDASLLASWRDRIQVHWSRARSPAEQA